jgi:purine-nucleoside phosphorylase
VVAPVRALARAGVRAVVLTNAAGGIRPTFRRGDLMLVSDHINGFGADPLSGGGETGAFPRFVDLTAAYDPELRRAARKAARSARIRLSEGVYAGVPGPSFETPAEIRMWRRLGADAIGMSTVPEVIALRGLGVRVLAISLITNRAAGLERMPLRHSDVLAAGEEKSRTLGALLKELIPRIDDLVHS